MRAPKIAPALALCAVLGASASALAQPLIVETEPLSPAEQRAAFRVPDGFEVQLVAAEPDIQKPMNLAFDGAGRLWVTHSTDYPFPADPPSEGRDGVTILGDFAPDGRARSVTRFAEGLTIPIGIAPAPAGDSAIIWAIPHIRKLTDTDGDGRADRDEPLFTGFEYIDTHGNQNAFRRGLDGWVYAAHGFRNHSRVRRAGGEEVLAEMQSGHTYRFRPDGSALEVFTHGQVNPFGLAFDPLGNLYSADCHSRPLYLLLRGAHYPGFGRPHDGLGFGPEAIDHAHGSTGIAGIVYYDAAHFPDAYRGNVFIGNPVTHRVHRDRLRWRGASPTAETLDDLVRCDDPWFRPADIRLGPDGALYIADFYNRIIGHYEVPLDHPQRDRRRGRIWRIVYRGPGGDAPAPRAPDLTKLGPAALAEMLGSENLTVRTLATHLLVERYPDEAAQAVRGVVGAPSAGDAHPAPRRIRQRAHAIWVLHRLGELDEQMIRQQIAHADDTVRVHLLRALAERCDWSERVAQAVRERLRADPSSRSGMRPTPGAFVALAAADALGRHPDLRNVRPLLDLLAAADERDDHLIHTLRMALRHHIAIGAIAARLGGLALDRADHRRLAETALGAHHSGAASFLLDHLRDHEPDRPLLTRALPHIAEHLPPDRTEALIELAQRDGDADLSARMSLFTLIEQGFERRRLPASEALRRWAVGLARRAIDAHAGASRAWSHHPLPGAPPSSNPWSLQQRPQADGGAATLLSSHPRGEHLTGVLRSRPFEAPPMLRFYLAGHRGFPDRPPHALNRVRLVLAESGRRIALAFPPRSDTAQPVTWDLAEHAGQRVHIEIIDGDTAGAYAWLAAGRFDPPVVETPETAPADRAAELAGAMRLAGRYRVTSLTDPIAGIIADRQEDPAVRAAAAEALLALDRDRLIEPASRIVGDAREAQHLRAAVADLLGRLDSDRARRALLDALATAPREAQRAIAMALASRSAGADDLLHAIDRGAASARLLRQPDLAERLIAAGPPDAPDRIERLTMDLPPVIEQTQQLIPERRIAFAAAETDPARGREVFRLHCAACHRIDGLGAKIGPDLDGIGNRGLDRLLEDILDPSRNVDGAFRTSTVRMRDGRTLSGLAQRTEGRTLILIDAGGQEHRLALGDIQRRTESNLSLMPPTFAFSIPEQDFHHLVALLLSHRAGD